MRKQLTTGGGPSDQQGTFSITAPPDQERDQRAGPESDFYVDNPLEIVQVLEEYLGSGSMIPGVTALHARITRVYDSGGDLYLSPTETNILGQVLRKVSSMRSRKAPQQSQQQGFDPMMSSLFSGMEMDAAQMEKFAWKAAARPGYRGIEVINPEIVRPVITSSMPPQSGRRSG